MILVGLFSAKDDHYQDAMDALEAEMARAGNLVVARVVQRKGVSRGGVRRMTSPIDPATYIGRGKAGEVAALRRQLDADLIVVRGRPSAAQLERLRGRIGCEVVAAA